MPSTLKQSLNLGVESSELVTKSIQEKTADYQDEEDQILDNYPNYDNYIGYEEYDPLKKLELLQREKQGSLGKKSDYDFMRRSDYPELAYSY